jgi:hypothetical protein
LLLETFSGFLRLITEADDPPDPRFVQKALPPPKAGPSLLWANRRRLN